LLRYAGHWALLGYGYWVAEEKSTGAFVGELGFADYKRDLQPALPEVPEAGWVLMPWAHGKGYATEAVRAIALWGDAHFARQAHHLLDTSREYAVDPRRREVRL